MAVRGSSNHYLIEKIQRRHWTAQAQQVGLGARAAEQAIEEVIEATAGVIGRAGRLLPDDFPADLAEGVFGGMRRHCARLKNMR